MMLVRIRILIGLSIFAGLLFCGWWTYQEVSERISGEAALAEKRNGAGEDESNQLQKEALREWTWPLVVYLIMLALVAAATVDEIRRSRRPGQ